MGLQNPNIISLLVYSISACISIYHYDAYPDTSAAGGIAFPDQRSRASCLHTCEHSDSYCFGFDWDPQANPPCWIHMSSPVTRTHVGVTHYASRTMCLGKLRVERKHTKIKKRKLIIF